MKTQPFKGRGGLIPEASRDIGRAAAKQDAAVSADVALAAYPLAQLEDPTREVMSLNANPLLVRRGVTPSEKMEPLMHEREVAFEGLDVRVATDRVRVSLRERRDTVLPFPGRVMVRPHRLVPGLFERVARRMAAAPEKKDV